MTRTAAATRDDADRPGLDSTDLDRVFAALADPTRRALLDRLTRGPASISELADPFPISLPAVLKHLRVLGDAGLVDRAKRGRTVHCRLAGARLAQARQWLTDCEAFWTGTLERLTTLLEPPELLEPPDRPGVIR